MSEKRAPRTALVAGGRSPAERALIAAERENVRLQALLKQYENSHKDVIAIVAHELRTPLTSIVGYADMVAGGAFGPISDGLRRPLEVIRRNGHRLKRLADEMLESVRLDAEVMPLRKNAVDILALVADVAAEMEPMLHRRTQAMVLQLPAAATAMGAQDKLHQVLINLLSNATKYSPEGAALVCRVDHPPVESLGGPWVRIVIENPGPGIPADVLPRLFEPFGTFSNAAHYGSGTADSSGLGLYIARRLVERQDGVISVVSDTTKTQFTVLLPAGA